MDNRYPDWIEILVCQTKRHSEVLDSFLSSFVDSCPRHNLGCADDTKQLLELVIVLGKRPSQAWILCAKASGATEPLIVAKLDSGWDFYDHLKEGPSSCLLVVGYQGDRLVADKFIAVLHSVRIVDRKKLANSDRDALFFDMLFDIDRANRRHGQGKSS